MNASLESDASLVRCVKQNNCETSFAEICKRHENLFYKICHRYDKKLNSFGIKIQEVLEDKYFVIFTSIISFDESKNCKFSTWLANQARFNCLNKINKSKNFINLEEEGEAVKFLENLSFEEYFKATKKINTSIIIDLLSKLDDTRIVEIFRKKYVDGESKTKWSHIAKEMGVSTQTILNLHKKGLQYISKKIKTIDIYE